jgi:hypothetical protein
MDTTRVTSEFKVEHEAKKVTFYSFILSPSPPPLIAITMSTRPMPRMVTRPRNADTHPGNLIPKQKRRTKEEMKQGRASEAEKKTQEQRKKGEALERVARLEASMKASDFQANQLPEKKPASDESFYSSGDEGQQLVPEAVNVRRSVSSVLNLTCHFRGKDAGMKRGHLVIKMTAMGSNQSACVILTQTLAR